MAVEHQALAAAGPLYGRDGLKASGLHLLQLDLVSPRLEKVRQELCDRCLFGLEAGDFDQVAGQVDDAVFVHLFQDLLGHSLVHKPVPSRANRL